MKLFLFRLLSLRLVKVVIDELQDKGLKGYIRSSLRETIEKVDMLIHE